MAAGLRLWGIWFGFPATYARPDEDTITATAVQMFADGPHPKFFNYPTLYLYFVSAAAWMWYAVEWVTGTAGTQSEFAWRALSDRAPLYLAARIISALAGIATVGVTFLAARAQFDRRVALIAAVLMAAAFLHVRDSHFGTTDVPATFMLMAAFWIAASRPLDLEHRWNVVVAATLCGLAASTKYNAALVVVPMTIAIVHRGFVTRTGWPRVLGTLAMAAGCAIAGFAVGTPYSLIEWRDFAAGVQIERQHLADGHGVMLGRGWVWHLLFSLRHGVGLPMLAAAAAGVLAVVRRPAHAAVLLSFPVVYYLALGSGYTVFVRYMVPVVPFLCILAAAGIDAAARVVSSSRGPAFQGAAIVAVAAAVMLGPATKSIAFDRLLGVRDSRAVAAAWLEETRAQGGSVFQAGGRYAQLELPEQFTEWLSDPAIDWRSLPPSALPHVVVVPISPPEMRWQDAFRDTHAPDPEVLQQVLDKHYALVKTWDVNRPGATTVASYDPQDAFYLPMNGFGGIVRPGPEVRIYQRAVE